MSVADELGIEGWNIPASVEERLLAAGDYEFARELDDWQLATLAYGVGASSVEAVAIAACTAAGNAEQRVEELERQIRYLESLTINQGDRLDEQTTIQEHYNRRLSELETKLGEVRALLARTNVRAQ